MAKMRKGQDRDTEPGELRETKEQLNNDRTRVNNI